MSHHLLEKLHLEHARKLSPVRLSPRLTTQHRTRLEPLQALGPQPTVFEAWRDAQALSLDAYTRLTADAYRAGRRCLTPPRRARLTRQGAQR